MAGVTAERFRDAFTRPLEAFYSRLLERPVTENEFRYFRAHYERAYYAAAFSMPLAPDAPEALDHVDSCASQSILSMAPHAHLQEIVRHHGIGDRFVRVEGSHTGSSVGNKAAGLRAHLDELGVAAAATVVIGDTVDDFEAAVGCGATAVLVTTGSQSRPQLEATGAPVVDSLLAAARMATTPAGREP